MEELKVKLLELSPYELVELLKDYVDERKSEYSYYDLEYTLDLAQESFLKLYQATH